MLITAIFPSRGRVHTLLAAMSSLRYAESGKHQVQYGICCDVDDPATIGVAKSLQSKWPVAYMIGERPQSLGGMVNKMSLNMPADVYLSLSDDMLCMTKDWDEKLALAVEKTPHGVWWWANAPDSQNPFLYAMVSEKWREAYGQIFTDYFPFWWDDLWLAEVWMLATEGPLLHSNIVAMDCPTTTMRMRDLRFWSDFYQFMRPKRIKDAKMLAQKLGLPAPTVSEALAEHIGSPSQKFLEQAAVIEANQGEQGPPTPEYLRAKKRAEVIMKAPSFLREAAGAIQRYDEAVRAA